MAQLSMDKTQKSDSPSPIELEPGIGADNSILVCQSIRALIQRQAIQALRPVRPEQVQPSSLDLRLGARIWQLQCSFLPGTEGIERKLGRLATTSQRLDSHEPVVLHQGGVYLAELEEVLELPEGSGVAPTSKAAPDDWTCLCVSLQKRAMPSTLCPLDIGGAFSSKLPPSPFMSLCVVETPWASCAWRAVTTMSVDELTVVQQTDPLCVWSDGSAAP